MESIKDYVALRKRDLHSIILEAKHKYNFNIILAIIQVGDNPASNVYVKGKIKDCNEVGVVAKLYKLSERANEEKLLSLINKLNKNNKIDGIIVQLPLPKHISEENIKMAIAPQKDVDGFHPLSKFIPCTPKGIVDYLDAQKFNFEGKHAVVIGRSSIVGKPMYKELLKRNCTVSQLHSKTTPTTFKKLVESADLIVTATGYKDILTKKFKYKKSAIIMDVGITRDEHGKLHGDCEPELNVAYQSPVPGGVGLLTRIALVENVVNACLSKYSE